MVESELFKRKKLINFKSLNLSFSATFVSADADPDLAAADPEELGNETTGPHQLRPILRQKSIE
ncbi:hypothetical protein TorRG33x02_186330 [Trema orientale]|uniref:Uncharacterized protein n=1 Tax=Trema orientale TaxID=63057 RepID=A0A2P5EJB2_TREOI|nr:hypothetical protein TorRG33x02_186330 [Trema orientale]